MAGWSSQHLVPALAVAVALGTGAPGAWAGPAKAREPRRGDPIPSVAESASERRAVRGAPVEVERSESPELRSIREFEAEAFPRPGDPAPVRETITRPAEPAAPLPGRWAGSGDLPSELRTPEVDRQPRRDPPAPDLAWLRGLRMPEIPVRWDPAVVRYLGYWKDDPRGRAIMSNWLRRLGRYRALFERILEREGVPKDLVYLAMVESGLDAGASSRAGAAGIWQFMPAVGRAYGLEVSYWVDGRRDPERAVEAAARNIKDLFVRFGAWELVFAAYNAGYGNVLRSIQRYNTNDYWELIKHEAGLPWESSVYVPRIVSAAIVGWNREAFGFGSVEADPPFSFERAMVPPGTTLAAVARAAGTKVEVIESLNPDLVRGRTPPDRPALGVRVPADTAALVGEALDRSRTAADKVDTIVLRFGESLDDVARARGLAVRDLRRLNGLRDSAELRAGVTVVVPKRTEPPAAAPAPEDDDDQILVAVPDRVFPMDGRERLFYRTRDADTVDEIAEAFRVDVSDLCEWNNLDPAAKLHPKMILQVFVPRGFDSTGIALLDADRLRVVTLGSEEFLELEAARRGRKRLTVLAKDGDTLAKIGRRYGLTVGDLARINRFSYATELTEGQKIVVYSPTGEPARQTAVGRSAPRPLRPAPAALAKVDTRPTQASTNGKVTTKPGVAGKPVAGASKPVASAPKPAAPAVGKKPPAAPAPTRKK